MAFVTGHAAGGDVPGEVDWTALARGAQVLVLYMALKHLEAIAARLMAAGRARETPVAVVSKATTPEQRVLESTLERCAAEAQAAGIEPPAVIVVGEVVRLRQMLDWLGAGEGRERAVEPALAPARPGQLRPPRPLDAAAASSHLNGIVGTVMRSGL